MMRLTTTSIIVLLLLLNEWTIVQSSHKEDYQRYVDDYHYLMVSDSSRNEMYYSALQKAMITRRRKKGSSNNESLVVLDAGAGTMLLSMMALDLGATRVLGVESNPLMCSIAREVLSLNNYSSASIALYEGAFETLRLGHHLRQLTLLGAYLDYDQIRQRADILVSETFDAGLVGENFLSILTHARISGLLTKRAIIIPSAARVYVQLLESTMSLPMRDIDGSDGGAAGTTTTSLNTSTKGFLVKQRYNLEPLRRHRRANGYTVRYLNEDNSVRRRLSAVLTLFDMDFQHYDVKEPIRYSCLVVNITADGLLDSLGLWFDLFLDEERQLVLSNSPYIGTAAAAAKGRTHWMQMLYRLSEDMVVRRGDLLRIQIVQYKDQYVISNVGQGQNNRDARLLLFRAVNCSSAVQIFSYSMLLTGQQRSQQVGLDGTTAATVDDDTGRTTPPPLLTPQEEMKRSEYLLGTIPVEDAFKVFAVSVYQYFMLVARLPTGKKFGMWYQLLDSTTTGQSSGYSADDRASIAIPLDSYDIVCPT